ncbi:probable glucuronosyltransferase Os02g0520750 isoform X3 [Quercus suber]|uniref:probable glucuronosyltransferase Os02g0520750 isoform X3 n=1 Tax=Quercus suber TaxID=58331 RepID=UPI0032DE4F5E
MGSIGGSKGRLFAAHHAPLCTRTHQIGSLLLVLTTFFLTRLLDRSLSTTFNHVSVSSGSSRAISFTDASGSVSLLWPERGYGSHLSLKIYVYDENEIDGLKPLMYGRDGRITAEGCSKGQWGTQVKIHKLLLKSRYRTTKKEEADLFFVPAYVKCVRMMGGLNDKEINHTYVKVLSQMPYFRRSGGRDHIFVFPSGAGAHFFRSWATYINRSIILTPELESPELKFSGPDKLGRIEYFEHLRNAKFCLAPRGESSWSLRYYESYFVECVPVIISDQVELPFQNVLDYRQISIKWPSTQIGPQMLEYLESIPDEDIERMINRGRQLRCLWVYAPESEPCSALRGILWELQRKVRHFHQSAETFWLHNGSIVNRNLVEFSHWKPPMLLP